MIQLGYSWDTVMIQTLSALGSGDSFSSLLISERRMAASVLKQEPNTSNVKKIAIY